MTKKPTLLSPVGSFESLHAAIRAGADAIYFGVEQLNMRAKSVQSFSIHDLTEISKVCKTNDVKAYITLNTVMFDYDMQLVKTILQAVKQANIDAVIAADFAVIELCRSLKLPLHISTQANVSNLESVGFFSSFADVVVLARELSLKQVAGIVNGIAKRNIKGVSGELMKIEIFAHGALCMAVSGKCYMSLHEKNASANRGACAQNCRRPYKVTDLETGNELTIDNEYIMSPKDLCTLPFLDEVIASGTDVLKIEGRGKGPEYVYTVTKCYREAIDAVAANEFTAAKVEAWMKQLETVYNRGFWDGYYLGRKLGEWTKTPGSSATQKKVFLGKAVNYYSRSGIAEFLLEAGSIQQGDELLITGRKFGVHRFTVNEFQANGVEATVAEKGASLTFPLAESLMRNDKLYKIVAANG